MKRSFSFRCFVLAVVFVLLVPCFAVGVSAASGSVSVSLSSGTVYLGNYVYVTVKYSSSTPMATWSFGVKYDSSRLQYISGAHSTTGGTLNFVDQPTSGGVTSKSYTITFKAIALGNASVSTVTREVYAENYSSISISDVSRTVKITERPAASSENRLSSLSIEGFELSPAFDAEAAEYTATVPYAVKQVSVKATPQHSAATASVRGAEELVVGENQILVTVTAENGNTRTYTVRLTREDSAYVAASVSQGEKNYTFPRDPSEVTVLPEGFVPVEGVYGGQRVLLFQNGTGSVTLAVLLEKSTDAEGNETLTEHLFRFDPEGESFLPYLTVTTLAQTFVFLDKPANVNVPDGFEETVVIVAETEIAAWAYTPEDGSEPIVLVYATDLAGEGAFYIYDHVKGSFDLYREGVPQTSSDGKTMEEMEAQRAELIAQCDSWKRTWFYTILAASVLVLILLILVIVLFVRSRRKKGGNDPDDFPLYSEKIPAPPVPVPGADETDFSGADAPESALSDETLQFSFESETEGAFEPISAPEDMRADFAQSALPEEPEDVTAWEEAPEEEQSEDTFAADAAAAEMPEPAAVQDDGEVLIPSPRARLRPQRYVQTSETREKAGEEHRGHPAVEEVFRSAHADEHLQNQSPIIDEDEEDDGDAPVYGFEE